MKKKFLAVIIFLTLTAVLAAQPEYSRHFGLAGDFSRMGFGARGMGMGNSMSAVTTGNLVSYYNPALSAFQQNNSFQTSYTFLSFDRHLNFLSFTRRFDFYSIKDSAADNPKPRSSAGISAGIINAGVSDIQGYDNHGFKTEMLSTSENQFFLGLANRFSEKFSIGIAVKFYYYKLYEKITSTGLGFDLGALYKLNENINFSFVLADINSKYKWDSAPVYEQSGTNIEDKFPILRKIGVSYFNQPTGILSSFEFESSNAGFSFIRFGVEYNLFENLFLRGGVDRISISTKDYPIRPAAGFSYSKFFGSVLIGIDYAFMIEPYSSNDRHVVGLSILF